MLLPAMTFGEMPWDRERWVGADSNAVSELCFRNTLVGSGWAIAVLLCMNGLRNQSSCPARHPFLAGKPLSQSGQAVAS